MRVKLSRANDLVAGSPVLTKLTSVDKDVVQGTVCVTATARSEIGVTRAIGTAIHDLLDGQVW